MVIRPAPSSGWSTRLAWALCAAMIALAPRANAELEVNVTRVGFPTLHQGDVVRSGVWVPVIVDVALIGEPAFDGTVRLAQLDADGDACYDQVDLHLRADTGGTQRIYLYAVANPTRGDGRFIVEVRDENGDAVEVISQGVPTRRAEPAQHTGVISHDDLLIVSISTESMGRVGDLVDLTEQVLYTRTLRVGHMSPTDLPELWIGLEAVDYLLWDDANPEDLTEQQLGALMEWTRQGGTLVIAAAQTAGAIELNEGLYKLLPVDLGEITTIDDLPSLRGKLLNTGKNDTGFRRPVPMVNCTLRDGAWLIERDADSDVITRTRAGRGHVIFVGVTLKDLFSGETGRPVEFFRTLFTLRTLGSEEDPPTPETLFERIVGAVSFTRSASLYLLAAGLFSATYLLIATVGTWRLLSTRGWRHHSWNAFAAIALAASLLSVLAVKSVRGFTQQLHQIAIIDMDAGQAHGHATVFFGLKTSSDREVDVWLPSNPLTATEPVATACFLRPLPAGNTQGDTASSFADPEEYRLHPGSAVIDNVRIRATLKRFEGRWTGPIGGAVTGKLTIRRQGKAQHDWRFTDDSHIVNELGVDLNECYILHTIFDMYAPTGGFDTRDNRSDKIYAYYIGDVPSDGQPFHLAPQCYKVSGNEEVYEAMKKRTLEKQQTAWSGPFRNMLTNISYGRAPTTEGFSLGDEKNALLLMSTVGEFDPHKGAGILAHGFGARTWSRDRLRQIDLRDQLRRDAVYLIGFADDPSPIRLFTRTGKRDYRACVPDPEHSRTMYRIHLPAEVVGSTSRADEEEDVQ